MTLDINELERLHAEAKRPDGAKHGLNPDRVKALRSFVHRNAFEIAGLLKAAEEMREAAVVARGDLERIGNAFEAMGYTSNALEVARGNLGTALAAYDAASRPISATSGVVTTDSAVDGASS